MNAKKFNQIISAIKKADKNQAERIQQAIEFCFYQAAENENLTPIDKLLNAVGSTRTIRHKQVKAYITAHLSGISIEKNKPTRKKKGKQIEFTQPAVPWYEYGKQEIEKAEATAVAKINLEKRLQNLVKAVANAEIQGDKQKIKELINKLERMIA